MKVTSLMAEAKSLPGAPPNQMEEIVKLQGFKLGSMVNLQGTVLMNYLLHLTLFQAIRKSVGS